MADYLDFDDLVAVAGALAPLHLFDDDNDGVVAPDNPDLVLVLSRAEAEAATYLGRNYGVQDMTLMAAEDPAFRGHVAWVAMHFATERKPEFVGANGVGNYKEQYDRAIAFFKSLARSTTRSASRNVSSGANSGGVVNPPLPTPTSPRFVFAPDKNNPGGTGGF